MQGDKKAYRIKAPPYRHQSAGIRTLYRLATLLRERGFEAVVNDKPGNDDYVAVYPETTKDINPFGARHWVRYCLHRPGVVGGPRSFPKGTVKFWYSPIFRGADLQDHLLTIQTTELELFNLEGTGVRDTTSTWIGRAERRGYLTGKPVGETIITHDWPPTRKEVANLLKRSKIFYTYEPFTALTTEAALCGCPSIIMTDMSKYPISRGEMDSIGVAQGPWVAWGPEEIDKARQGLPSVLSSYLAVEENMNAQLKDFIEVTQNM